MSSIDISLTGLTEEQQRVVTHRDGPAVVVACPGSGKTRALTHRIAYLVRKGVSPANILGITFTRAAAEEMRTRLAGLIPPPMARYVRLFTFHGLAWRILTEIQGRPKVLGERDQKAMAGQLLKEFHLNADETSVDNLLTDFAFFVGTQIPMERFRPGSCDPDLFRQIWARYRQLKAERNLVDFDDLIVWARDLLRDNPSHRRAQTSRIRYLLVDEFQDTNALQWEFLQLLIPDENNIMVVGDDDQAIYGWRGASPSFMLDFPTHFPGCAQLRLTRNFRSTASILEPAGRLIAVNTRRYEKRVVAVRPPAQPPVFMRPEDAVDEATRITAAIRERLAAGVDPSKLAVLYRAHLLAFPLMNRLEKAGVPFRVLGGRPNPFTRWMARDVLAYLRWAYGEATLEEIARVLRRPPRRGISRELVTELQQSNVQPGDVLNWLADRVTRPGLRELDELCRHLQRLTRTPAGEAIGYIRSRMGYDDYVEQYCRWAGSDPLEAAEVLSALEQIPDPAESSRIYINLAEQAGRREEESEDPSSPAVTLASFHGSKGLEWDQVWVLSAVEGAVPNRLAIEGGSLEALEEERRLFYVGMTRAKNLLIISAPRKLLGSEATPSRFVVEAGVWTPPPPRKRAQGKVSAPPWLRARDAWPPVLPEKDYVPGVVCWHVRFGEGVIRWVQPRQGLVEIYFRQIGQTKLLSIDTCIRDGLLRAAKS